MKLLNTLTKSILGGGTAALCAASPLTAQTSYTVVDLTAAGSYGIANAAGGGLAGGYTSLSPSPLDSSRAALWTGTGLVDLHPALLGDPANSTSTVQGISGNLQVGWGIGPNTGGQAAALFWHNTAKSAKILVTPFDTYGAQALATDGVQVVGLAGFRNRNGSGGPLHAVVWNAKSGVGTDLGDGGGGAEALGVAGGQQVGYGTQSSGPVATIWSGSSRSQVVIHPKNAVSSELFATNGTRQAGFTGYDIKVVDEAHKGRTIKRVNYATIWNGTTASAQVIHPAAFTQSYAAGVVGSVIVGYAYNGYDLGSVASYHAILWNANLQPIDLNTYLPAGFTGGMANSIDAQGNIAGTIFTADGLRHAAMWIPNP
jgi:hypothetical protein